MPDKIFRDPCQCRSTRPKEITFTARGTGYGGVESWEDIKDEDRLPAFIRFCEKYNVEWVV